MKLYQGISGLILAGGQSRRMGFPKPFLTVEGKRIINTTLKVFKSLFEEIFIVTGDKNHLLQFKGIKVVEDLIKESGPLGGIYTG